MSSNWPGIGVVNQNDKEIITRFLLLIVANISPVYDFDVTNRMHNTD